MSSFAKGNFSFFFGFFCFFLALQGLARLKCNLEPNCKRLTPPRSVLDFEFFAGQGQMLDGQVLEASQVEYKPFGNPLYRETPATPVAAAPTSAAPASFRTPRTRTWRGQGQGGNRFAGDPEADALTNNGQGPPSITGRLRSVADGAQAAADWAQEQQGSRRCRPSVRPSDVSASWTRRDSARRRWSAAQRRQ